MSSATVYRITLVICSQGPNLDQLPGAMPIALAECVKVQRVTYVVREDKDKGREQNPGHGME